MSSLLDQLFESILMARQRVYAVAPATPLEEMNANLPFRLFLKREDLGPIKAYKWRGSYNRMAMLTEAERKVGVVSASAGNHAQGVALAASLLGINARIYMPRPTPQVKQEAVKRFGGERVEIILHGDSFDEASAAAMTDVAQSGRTFIHPYDDLDVMGGQGTLADEIVMSGQGPFDVALLQIGGGGMAAAAACWLKRQYPGIRIIGVEGNGQACMTAANKAGHPVSLEKADIFCDGTAVKQAGNLTYELCRELIDEYVSVTNDDVCWAVQSIWEANRIIVETSGAMGVAAALKLGEKLRGKNVLAVLSGANIDFGKLGYITRNSQVDGASRHYIRLCIPEKPGALLDVLENAFGEENIIEFQYGKTDKTKAWFTIGVAAGEQALAGLAEKLSQLNIQWENVTGHEDVSFRVIRYEASLLANPIFLNLDFYERPGALHDFLLLLRNVADCGNICYFNYAYTGERIGRALLGIDFPSEEAGRNFLKGLPDHGTGFRSCRAVNGPANERLRG
ncbi:MAG: pyridoxal-phosphate dependent enzyme [Puniceicoccales bacterium]|jgi:threonine dehydratase|nr:pyridoxal-phosphate dependent enzyme [Puniceicoccales bacterium]